MSHRIGHCLAQHFLGDLQIINPRNALYSTLAFEITCHRFNGILDSDRKRPVTCLPIYESYIRTGGLLDRRMNCNIDRQLREALLRVRGQGKIPCQCGNSVRIKPTKTSQGTCYIIARNSVQRMRTASSDTL